MGALHAITEAARRLTGPHDVAGVLAEAIDLLPGLLGADGVVQVLPDGVVGVSTGGELPPLSWPDLWSSSAEGDREPVVAAWDGPGGGGSLVTVPVFAADQQYVLCCFRRRAPAFDDDDAEVAAAFAGHIGPALDNVRLRDALAVSETSLRLVADSISDMVAVVDASGRYVYASPSHDRQLGRSAAGLVGSDVGGLVHPADRSTVEAFVAPGPGAGPGASSGPGASLEYRLRSGTGEWVWVESRRRPAPDDGVVLASHVIDDRRRLEDELRRRSTHDPLTGLANRALGTQRLTDALAEGRPGSVGVLFCDIDRFKEINDRLGHEAGDELLVHVADRLRGCIRRGDLLSRFGGDEFVAVLDNPRDTTAMTEVAARMVSAITEPLRLRGERVQVTAGIGGAFARRGSSTASAMLRDADSAMHTAKDHGRGQVRVFDEAAAVRSRDRLEVSSNLGAALARGELLLHYQPIVELDGQRLVGFEALARWKHPTRGFIPPDVFIPIAEDTGAIVEIGDWVLDQASRQLASWRSALAGTPMRMNVNLSAVQIEQPDAADRAIGIIRGAGAAPDDLWLEVTEQRSIRDDVTQFTDAMRSEGVHFALDDFGMSYSNLGHLERLPVELLKIDKSFVDSMTSVTRDRGIVRAVLAIADSLGLAVVAEGIETGDQLSALLDLGCGHGQGYLFSRPVPAARADQMVSDLIGATGA